MRYEYEKNVIGHTIFKSELVCLVQSLYIVGCVAMLLFYDWLWVRVPLQSLLLYYILKLVDMKLPETEVISRLQVYSLSHKTFFNFRTKPVHKACSRDYTEAVTLFTATTFDF